MASVKSDISLQIKNNLNRTASFSILGGTQDPSNGQANAKTIYEWDLTAETFANTTVATIEASTINNATVINYEVSNQDGLITDIKTVVKLLNTLNLGVFNLDGNTIWIIDDINIFGNLEILINTSFDINVFVQDAYNYFDALGKTPLADFQAQYTSVIQQAVDTIPDFVDFVETQGWDLCYPITASGITMTKGITGSIFVVTETGGVLATNEFANLTSVVENGSDSALIYAPNVNSFTTLGSANFTSSSVNSFIFKYLFEASFSLSFGGTLGFKFLDPSYFPSSTTNFQSIFIMPSGINQLNLYGTEFPKLNIQDGQYIISAVGGNDIDLVDVGSKIVFNTLANNTRLTINRIFTSALTTIDIDFSTLTLSDSSQGIIITTSDLALQNVALDSSFNEKFNYLAPLYGDTLTLGSVSGLVGLLIDYDDTSPLELHIKNIDFSNSVTTNLPPIGTDSSGQIGFVNGSDYSLYLDISDQIPLTVGTEMQYFNNWFFELGTQSFLQSVNAITVGLLGVIDSAGTNSFILSGQGIYGYYALLSRGFTINTPVGAITNNLMSFTINNGKSAKFTTVSGLGQSSFETTEDFKGGTEIVRASTQLIVGTEEIQYGVVTADTNVIVTSDPTLICIASTISENSVTSNYDIFSTMLIGNGVFGQNLGNITIEGFTLSMPLNNDNTAKQIGLYQRDFSGLDSTNCTGLAFIKFKINQSNIIDSLSLPFGAKEIFNLNTVNPITTLYFEECLFGTVDSHNDTSTEVSPLEILYPSLATPILGFTFADCNFNYSDRGVGNNKFSFRLNSSSGQALCGVSTINNTNFCGTLGVKEFLFLSTSYNGTGSYLGTLTIEACTKISEIELLNVNTTPPPSHSINLNNLPSLETFNYSGNNLTLISISLLSTCSDFNVASNDLSSTSLDNIIVNLDANGQNNGILNYSNQTGGASPNIGVSGTAYNSLIAKGWTVTGNAPI